MIKLINKTAVQLFLLSSLCGCIQQYASMVSYTPQDQSSKESFLKIGECPLNSNSDECNLVNAAWFAQISMLTYKENQGLVRDLLSRSNLNEVEFFDNKATETQAFVAHNSRGIVVVAFRGTELVKLRDLVTNINAELTKYERGGFVHSGFYAAIKSVWEREGNEGISDHLRVLSEKKFLEKPRVWFTGHSLGGALATLAADLCVNVREVQVQGLYTFGAPRVGDNDFVDHYRVREVYRFVNNNDFAPHFPQLTSYKHVGSRYYIDQDGNVINEEEQPIYISSIDRNKKQEEKGITRFGDNFFKGNKKFDKYKEKCKKMTQASKEITQVFKYSDPEKLKDHKIIEYVKLLKNNQQR
ncbi:MAG: lipase family protein [Colwellia sp.]|nr:lipase family protein [Colwellia sp.]